MQNRNWTKRDSFAHFGAKSKSPVWSWSAISPDRQTVVITLWDDHAKRTADGWIYSNFGQDTLPSWRNLPGNRERVEYLKAAIDNCNGLFRVVWLIAKDNKVTPRKIARCYPDDTLIMQLTRLDESTGEFEAVSVPRA
jgi:hypothetical protein